jgi:hypothetical protein
MKIILLATAMGCVVLAGRLAEAATINWTNTASGNWGNAANWNPNTVPGATDTAIITNAGVTVTLDISPTVGGIILGDSGAGVVTLSPNNQTLSVNGPLTVNPSGSFTLDSGALSGNVTISGILNWTGGTCGLGNNALTIATNGTVILAGNNGGNYLLSENVTNAGTLRITGGNLQIDYCGSSGWGNLINLPGALVDMASDGSIFNSCGGPGFINGGTVRKSGGTGTNVITITPFTSFGTVDAQTGTISLNGNSTISGVLSAETNATLALSSGTITLNGNLISSNAVLAGGILSGNGTISGVLNWTGGTFGCFKNNALTIATNGTVVLAGTNGGTYLIAQSVTNAGTLRVQGGNLQIAWIGSGQYGQFYNLPGALVDLATDGPFGPDSDSPGFFNAGTLRKSGGTGTNNITGNVVNTGTVDARSGTITFESFANSASKLLVANGATIKIPQAVALPVLVTGSGTVQAPSITSSGVVSPGATNAVLYLAGNYTQLLGGSMQFDIGGNSPGVNQSQVNVTGSASLSGLIALRFSPGYVPAVNSSNLVLTAGSRSGQFPFQDHFYLLGQNKRIVPVYSPTNVVLTTIAAADPTNFSLSAAVQGQAFALAWPSEFGNHSLYANTNLNDTTWTIIPGVTNFYMETPMTSPQKFFRLF